MEYSIGGEVFAEGVPVGAVAGDYTVWYMVTGDENHNDTEPDKVISTITEKPAPAGGIVPALSGLVQNVGWVASGYGLEFGTTGESRRLEAVRIRLTGDAANEGGYSVWYRVHNQNRGWLGWAHDGQDAGTSGMSLRAEAIDVQVLPQGQVPAGYDGSAACVAR